VDLSHGAESLDIVLQVIQSASESFDPLRLPDVVHKDVQQPAE
jgi:hypothetical protein